jgi:hypothetical protein
MAEERGVETKRQRLLRIRQDGKVLSIDDCLNLPILKQQRPPLGYRRKNGS